MNILVINGSPRGKNSVTLQTVLYLEKRYPKNNFSVLQVGQQIKSYEKDFFKAKEEFEKAELIIFAYPVYTFLAPYQLHRFIELMKENGISLKDKFATQISTSKHFYDTTAHKYIEENCYDLEAKYIRGFSADMDDLLMKQGQLQADCFFSKLLFDISHCIYLNKEVLNCIPKVALYQQNINEKQKNGTKDVVIVTNSEKEDFNLQNMIADFTVTCEHPVRIVNVREFPFLGGCLGCFSCATTAKCVYKDGFDEYLRNEIQIADAIIYAFTIENHYTHSSFKCYDDRQFCNGHRSINNGMPVGYIISGEYQNENNIQTLVEARSEVSGGYLCGIATDENDTTKSIIQLADSLNYALTHKMVKPTNFYGVGGTKIFRDLVYLMQGMMKADHKFYKENGIYDFPQKKKLKILQMKIIGTLMSMPLVQKKMKGKMNDYILMPYKKVIESVESTSN